MTDPTVVSPVSWYDDLGSCLQIDIGYVLERSGWDPLQALATGWRYLSPDGPVEPVEYYHPAGDRIDQHLCLHHPVSIGWHRPSGPEDAHDQLMNALAAGISPITAVNNYHLPFRPAYHDVHAAHLVVVNGYDQQDDTYLVVDPMPPAFVGPLPRAVLEQARAEISVDDESDPFFAGSRPSWRWIEVRATGLQPDLDWPWLLDAVRGNLSALRRDDQGLAALARQLDELPAHPGDADPKALREIYVFGWPAQAEASLHAAFLARAARRLGRPDLAEAARLVDLVAHCWTGLRVAAAHGAVADDASAARVGALGRRLVLTWERCLQRLEHLTEEQR